MAFLDGFPITPAHTLVIPKRHVVSLFELPDNEQAAVWTLVAQVRAMLLAELLPDGFTVGLNDGTAAGQTVMHAHVHVIPRRQGDVPDPRGAVGRPGQGGVLVGRPAVRWAVHGGVFVGGSVGGVVGWAVVAPSCAVDGGTLAAMCVGAAGLSGGRLAGLSFRKPPALATQAGEGAAEPAGDRRDSGSTSAPSVSRTISSSGVLVSKGERQPKRPRRRRVRQVKVEYLAHQVTVAGERVDATPVRGLVHSRSGGTVGHELPRRGSVPGAPIT